MSEADDMKAMLVALSAESGAERDLLIRFIAAVDDQWDGDDFDIALFRKLAAAGRELLWPGDEA